MAFEKYNIREFRDALFSDDRSVMTDEILQLVYDEYIDASGLFDEEELQRVSYIYYLNGRINSIGICIDMQRRFIQEFGIPYINGFKTFNKLGYRIKWRNDIVAFLNELDKIESRESKYKAELDAKMKELTDIRSSKKLKTKPTRESFIMIVNSLGKAGYRISWSETTVEEFAIMIKQQTEESEKLKSHATRRS